MATAGEKTAGERKLKKTGARRVGLVAFALVVFAATTASAQTTKTQAAQATQATSADGFMDQTDKDGQKVIFKDDPLGAGNHDANGATILVRPTAARVGLLRPRVQFITEMLKSVENL
jgi:Cu/Ag efflux protein CusF